MLLYRATGEKLTARPTCRAWLHRRRDIDLNGRPRTAYNARLPSRPRCSFAH